MHAACVVVGEHDFTSFAAVDPERVERMASAEHVDEHGVAQATAVSNVRTIFSSMWSRKGDELVYTICGNGFLHHMVRNLVGTFALAGKRTLSAEDIQRILAARDRSVAGPTAPASGLYLVNVEYGPPNSP